MFKYDLSVIIPTYNRCKLLDFTLNSMILQEYPSEKFEVIVADDGSSDQTSEIVTKYQNELNIKYLFQEDNGYRPASARNLGVCNAEGKICFFVDAGVILNTQCIREHINMHKREEKSISILGYVFGFDQDGSCEENLLENIFPYDPQKTIAKL